MNYPIPDNYQKLVEKLSVKTANDDLTWYLSPQISSNAMIMNPLLGDYYAEIFDYTVALVDLHNGQIKLSLLTKKSSGIATCPMFVVDYFITDDPEFIVFFRNVRRQYNMVAQHIQNLEELL